MKRRLNRLLAFAWIWVIPATTGHSATMIRSVPFTVSTSGEYVLAANLSLAGTNETAITVNAADVVLDLKGFTLSTSDTSFSNYGIEVTDNTAYANAVIQNGSIDNFGVGVRLLGEKGKAQNLRLENNNWGIQTGSFNVIQNCFIAGTGTGYGIYLRAENVLVINNQIVSQQSGCYSGFGDGFGGYNCFIGNRIGSCTYGLYLSPIDKYQGNITTLCTTPFFSGIAVGTGNN
jgi:hypothetical protein